jgi:hypothetical protein
MYIHSHQSTKRGGGERGKGGGEEETPSNKLLLNVADYVSRYAEKAFQIRSVSITETGRIFDSIYGLASPVG